MGKIPNIHCLESPLTSQVETMEYVIINKVYKKQVIFLIQQQWSHIFFLICKKNGYIDVS